MKNRKMKILHTTITRNYSCVLLRIKKNKWEKYKSFWISNCWLRSWCLSSQSGIFTTNIKVWIYIKKTNLHLMNEMEFGNLYFLSWFVLVICRTVWRSNEMFSLFSYRIRCQQFQLIQTTTNCLRRLAL